MSFLNTLTTMAVGFAAAKGVEEYNKLGGMQGISGMLQNSGAPGGLADSLGGMAQQMGIPGGADAVKGLLGQVTGMMGGATGAAGAATAAAAPAGLGGLMTALTGAGVAGSGVMGELMGSLMGGTPASSAAEQTAQLMIRAMIQAAKADGNIDDDEKAKILGHISTSGPDETAYVQAQLAAPLDMASLVAATNASNKAQVYSASLMAIKVDSDVERAYLTQLAASLGIDKATRDAMHTAMGVPVLAS